MAYAYVLYRGLLLLMQPSAADEADRDGWCFQGAQCTGSPNAKPGTVAVTNQIVTSSPSLTNRVLYSFAYKIAGPGPTQQ